MQDTQQGMVSPSGSQVKKSEEKMNSDAGQ